MGHIVFAAPSISRFHLHHRLRRDLLRRGHRVSILCADRCRFTFWRDQVSDVNLLDTAPGNHCPTELRHVVEQVEAKEDRRHWHRLLPAALHWLEREQPDLVLFHDERSATTACLQFAARTVGSRVLWTGDGLLPHTMQVDERGLDADASCKRWTAEQFSVVAPDDRLLQASLTQALAGSTPLALPRESIHVPALRRRISDALHFARRGNLQMSMLAMQGWRAAFASANAAPPTSQMLDLQSPFIAVLLQGEHDSRVQHDAPPAPDARELIQRAAAAADVLGAGTQVVAVLPQRVRAEQIRLQGLAGQLHDRVRIAPAAHAAAVAATSAATITINHPMATVALLSGTPVVLLGRALYQLPGVTTQSTLHDLPAALATALNTDHPELRRPFLTWLLRHGHVWCSTTAPNHNGMLGLLQAIEQRLRGDAERNRASLHYRPGPSWPLATP